MYRFVETKRLTSHWEFEPDPLVGVPLVSTRSRLFRVAVVSFPWVTFPAGLPLPATVSVDKNAGNTNRGIRSSDNDSTASGHQVRCVPWVQMGTFNKEIGF